MATFYFTYGSDDDNQDYKGGWTEVEADTRQEAVAGYMAYHPANKRGLLPCCGVAYDRQQMERSGMLTEGNFGVFCHDRITIKRGTIAIVGTDGCEFTDVPFSESVLRCVREVFKSHVDC